MRSSLSLALKFYPDPNLLIYFVNLTGFFLKSYPDPTLLIYFVNLTGFCPENSIFSVKNYSIKQNAAGYWAQFNTHLNVRVSRVRKCNILDDLLNF